MKFLIQRNSWWYVAVLVGILACLSFAITAYAIPDDGNRGENDYSEYQDQRPSSLDGVDRSGTTNTNTGSSNTSDYTNTNSNDDSNDNDSSSGSNSTPQPPPCGICEKLKSAWDGTVEGAQAVLKIVSKPLGIVGDSVVKYATLPTTITTPTQKDDDASVEPKKVEPKKTDPYAYLFEKDTTPLPTAIQQQLTATKNAAEIQKQTGTFTAALTPAQVAQLEYAKSQGLDISNKAVEVAVLALKDKASLDAVLAKGGNFTDAVTKIAFGTTDYCGINATCDAARAISEATGLDQAEFDKQLEGIAIRKQAEYEYISTVKEDNDIPPVKPTTVSPDYTSNSNNSNTSVDQFPGKTEDDTATESNPPIQKSISAYSDSELESIANGTDTKISGEVTPDEAVAELNKRLRIKSAYIDYGNSRTVALKAEEILANDIKHQLEEKCSTCTNVTAVYSSEKQGYEVTFTDTSYQRNTQVNFDSLSIEKQAEYVDLSIGDYQFRNELITENVYKNYTPVVIDENKVAARRVLEADNPFGYITNPGMNTDSLLDVVLQWNDAQLANPNKTVIGGQLSVLAQNFTIPAIEHTDKDLDLLTRLILAETSCIRNADGTINLAGVQGVAEVVRNRVLSGGYPKNIIDVIYERDQFSPLNAGVGWDRGLDPSNPDYAIVRALAEQVLNSEIVPIAYTKDGLLAVNYHNDAYVLDQNNADESSNATKVRVGAMETLLAVVDATRSGVRHVFGISNPVGVFDATPNNETLPDRPTVFVGSQPSLVNSIKATPGGEEVLSAVGCVLNPIKCAVDIISNGTGSGTGGSNNNSNSNDSDNDNDNDKPPVKEPVEPPVKPQVGDLTTHALQASIASASTSTTTEYRFGGDIIRTYKIKDDPAGLPLKDIDKNYGDQIKNRLILDYLCDGTIDARKPFTLGYSAFDPNDDTSRVLTSTYLPITQTGRHCFVLETDITNLINETNEKNNRSATTTFTVTAVAGTQI